MEDKEKKTQQAGSCDSDCSHCASAGHCGSQPQSLLEKTNDFNDIKKVIAVVSGKGGVGKSLVTSLMAVTMKRRGYKTGILDADITGPSIPKAFGIEEKASANELGIFPISTGTGIETMSVNNLLENDTDPVIWRGPVIAGTVKQFWTDVLWGEVDYLFVDMPPGTGDVPLTVFQSLPVDGIIVVTSPQELVSMIVAKAVKMAEMMDIPVLGIVENMSYLKCPDCGSEISVFGPGKTVEAAEEHGLEVLGRIPIDPRLAAACDRGMIETFEGNWLEEAADRLEKM
ncbi:MAG TPA: Mrp/NBP35 family ATP-binding protein [Candidatus Copromorpha excrementigallinarum]|uniref:Iron-sulfur cluster carrier protein n=1 Tax=Candidatus Allocopromorpha excrementigallinarum TaxID=2840742 RepID=A0A9D1HZT0_9FIRM|nr:Mrp/NBP35 family ATP-binding protein [Candidatus Copromorpha excrementigallinarum]